MQIVWQKISAAFSLRYRAVGAAVGDGAESVLVTVAREQKSRVMATAGILLVLVSLLLMGLSHGGKILASRTPCLSYGRGMNVGGSAAWTNSPPSSFVLVSGDDIMPLPSTCEIQAGATSLQWETGNRAELLYSTNVSAKNPWSSPRDIPPNTAGVPIFVITCDLFGPRMRRLLAFAAAAPLGSANIIHIVPCVQLWRYNQSCLLANKVLAPPLGLVEGEASLTLSHKLAWKALINSGASHGIIMEDDAFLLPGAMQLLSEALRLLHTAKERVSVFACWNGDWNSNTISTGELVLSMNVSNATMRFAALPPTIAIGDISELRVYRMREAYIPGFVGVLFSAATRNDCCRSTSGLCYRVRRRRWHAFCGATCDTRCKIWPRGQRPAGLTAHSDGCRSKHTS